MTLVCRGNPTMCAKIGYCLHKVIHRQPECPPKGEKA